MINRSDDNRRKITSSLLDEGFLQRTYPSSAFLAGFAALYVWSHGWAWAALPLLMGAALGVALLYVAEANVRQIFTAGTGSNAAKKSRIRRVLLGVGLIKYGLVAVAAWAMVRYGSLAEVGAFAGGFSLVQIGIAFRVLSRCLVAGWNRDAV